MSTAAAIRALLPQDVDALMALRREALATAPRAFAASPEDDLAQRPERTHEMLLDRDKAVLGAFEGDALRAMVGLVRAPLSKNRHKAYIWGMYVTPGARRGGLGRRLLQGAIAQARAWGVELLHLSVTSAAPEAERLYREAGFRQWGREPRSLRHAGEALDEIHLVLEL